MLDSAIEVIKRKLSENPKQVLEDPQLKPAAVMLLVYRKNGEYCLLLNKRTQEVEHHKGEISFPGGAKDPEDKTMLDTALRETYEEMGIVPEDVRVLGELSDVATNSGFVINSFVATIPYPYEFTVSDAEIAEVIEMPLVVLLDPFNRREEVRVTEKGLVRSYSYAYNGHLVYGATARLLDQLVELLQSNAK